MKNLLKRTVLELLAGAGLGFLVWCLIGKSLTAMMFGTLGGSFSCSADVETALDKFLAMQLYSAAGGAIVVLTGMFFVRRALARSKNAKSAAAPQG